METVQRNTAYKVWIADLISGRYVKGQEQFESGYVEIKGNKISRVNIVGGVIDKFSGNNYVSVNLDDGSGVLRLKVWNEFVSLFSEVSVGDLVLIVGKVRDYNNSIYVAPEVVRKLDNPLWFKARKLELTKKYGEVQRVENVTPEVSVGNSEDDEMVMNVVEEKMGDSGSSREVLLSLIEKLDFGDGADLGEVVKKSGFNEANQIVEDLLRDGEVFEIHKGKLRVMG